jgi:nicotinamide-nucleotide amidase
MKAKQLRFGKGESQLTRAAQRAVEALAEANLTVVTAESCTGGLLALGVSALLLQRRGSVNREVALQMAEGALQRSSARLALSVTGVLGPDADEDGNPAGLVYLAVAQRAQRARVVEECIARGNPDAVRRHVLLRALELLRGAAA